jgi:hypothetical protein
MKKSDEVQRLCDMADAYSKMNVSEILDRVETLATDITFDPGMDMDELLGNAEEIVELVAVVRAHMGIAVPDYDHASNQRISG